MPLRARITDHRYSSIDRKVFYFFLLRKTVLTFLKDEFGGFRKESIGSTDRGR